jgi:hypothetical protein
VIFIKEVQHQTDQPGGDPLERVTGSVPEPASEPSRNGHVVVSERERVQPLIQPNQNVVEVLPDRHCKNSIFARLKITPISALGKGQGLLGQRGAARLIAIGAK